MDILLRGEDYRSTALSVDRSRYEDVTGLVVWGNLKAEKDNTEYFGFLVIPCNFLFNFFF